MVLPKGSPSYSARDEAYTCTAACKRSRRVRATVPWSSVAVRWWRSSYTQARPGLQVRFLVISSRMLVPGHGRWSSTAPATSCSPPPSGGIVGPIFRIQRALVASVVVARRLQPSPLCARALVHCTRTRAGARPWRVCVCLTVLLAQRIALASLAADCYRSRQWGVIPHGGASSLVLCFAAVRLHLSVDAVCKSTTLWVRPMGQVRQSPEVLSATDTPQTQCRRCSLSHPPIARVLIPSL